jgi:hypothetical protein
MNKKKTANKTINKQNHNPQFLIEIKISVFQANFTHFEQEKKWQH